MREKMFRCDLPIDGVEVCIHIGSPSWFVFICGGPGLRIFFQTSRRSPARCLLSANGAFSIQPGATPQVLDRVLTPALKARFKASDVSRRISVGPAPQMNRAFSAGDLRCTNSWGVAPGSNEPAPLALKMHAAIACCCWAGRFGNCRALIISQPGCA